MSAIDESRSGGGVAISHVESSIPPAMTIGEYRRSRPRRLGRRQRLMRLARPRRTGPAARP